MPGRPETSPMDTLKKHGVCIFFEDDTTEGLDVKAARVDQVLIFTDGIEDISTVVVVKETKKLPTVVGMWGTREITYIICKEFTRNLVR